MNISTPDNLANSVPGDTPDATQGDTQGDTPGEGLAPLVDEAGRARRWRLLLGDAAEGCAARLSGSDAAVDAALAALYDVPATSPGARSGTGGRRSAGLGGSAPKVARWLGDIRTYFPSTVVQVMQRDAVERLDLTRLLLEPELLGAVQPDVNLVGTLLSLGRVLPERTKETARQVVAEVVRQIEDRVAERTTSAVAGALNRAARTHRPRLHDVDWAATIRANLAHYLPEHRTVVPERLIGYGRRQQVVAKEVILEIDQSGSMAESVVYASVFGAVLAKMRTLKTTLIAFDTEVVDFTESLADPVDVLFGVQLGGGTDINRAIAYGQDRITRPADTLFFLISDLYEGGVRDEMVKRMAAMKAAGVQVIVLLALSDSGAPAFDRENAAALAALGIPAFACTPDAFPDLLSLAMTGGDVSAWAQREIAAAAVPQR
jgi:Mg-chelatase subunit ChlD